MSNNVECTYMTKPYSRVSWLYGSTKGWWNHVKVSGTPALIAVSKKDSSLKRFCLDLRPLNKQCKKLSVFQGSINTNLDRLHGSILYSVFDMSSGFMAVPLEDSSKQYFTFTTPNQGTYAFSVLPFRWVNSPAFYARFVSRLVSTMPVGSTLAYVDDILLHSKDASGIHMVQMIDQFLTQVEQSGAKIQVPKTALMKTQCQLPWVHSGVIRDHHEPPVQISPPRLPTSNHSQRIG